MQSTKSPAVAFAPSSATCPNGHRLSAPGSPCLLCEDAAAARREIELAEKHPREWNELAAALDALMDTPRRSPRRKHAEARAERAQARWREVEELA